MEYKMTKLELSKSDWDLFFEKLEAHYQSLSDYELLMSDKYSQDPIWSVIESIAGVDVLYLRACASSVRYSHHLIRELSPMEDVDKNLTFDEDDELHKLTFSLGPITSNELYEKIMKKRRMLQYAENSIRVIEEHDNGIKN